MTATNLRIGRIELRISGAGVEERQRGLDWAPVTLPALRRRFAADSPVWEWLREHGHVRPSPSGPSGRTQTDDDRRATGRVRVAVWISEEAARALERLAAGSTKAAAVERAVLAAAKR